MSKIIRVNQEVTCASILRGRKQEGNKERRQGKKEQEGAVNSGYPTNLSQMTLSTQMNNDFSNIFKQTFFHEIRSAIVRGKLNPY